MYKGLNVSHRCQSSLRFLASLGGKFYSDSLVPRLPSFILREAAEWSWKSWERGYYSALGLTSAERFSSCPHSTDLAGPCLFSNQDVALVTAVGSSGVHCGPSEYNSTISDVPQWVTLNPLENELYRSLMSQLLNASTYVDWSMTMLAHNQLILQCLKCIIARWLCRQSVNLTCQYPYEKCFKVWEHNRS